MSQEVTNGTSTRRRLATLISTALLATIMLTGVTHSTPVAEAVSNPAPQTTNALNVRHQVVPVSMPVHGNWCGPGHGNGPAVDALDALCKQHDLCYEKAAYFNCDCNAALTAGIAQIMPTLSTLDQVKASLFGAVFANLPCTR